MKKNPGKIAVCVIAVILLLCFATTCLFCFTPVLREKIYLLTKHKEADPTGFAVYTKPQYALVKNADFYLSPDGSDENDGSFEHPFATVKKARDVVRTLSRSGRNGITVALKKGEYRVDKIEFDAEDGGTSTCPVTYCAYGDGEVIVNGGKVLEPSSFSSVTDPSVKSRLTDDAAKNVVCADLKKIGLTIDDWGKLFPVGKYGTASHYDGETTGPSPCVLYYNGAPFTTARYPNNGFLTVQSIEREGDGEESSTSNHVKRTDWATLRNPQSDVFTIDDDTAERIRSYASLENVWLWTALMYNWADTTVPLKNFDYAKKTLEPAYVSVYGAVPGSTYYIFNVIEELDVPGEWYLDRENGIVYIYPQGNLQDAEINISLSTQDIITVNGASFMTFDGLSVRGTRGNGIVINGNDVCVKNCFISDLSGTGIDVNGYRNRVTDCELSHIGATGVNMNGGDRETLTPSDNRLENCLIHDFSEEALTAGPGVNIEGVGNLCSHNEFFNAPQQAIFYAGNNNLIEYNLMHEIALLSDDCSAVYAGRRWDYGGNVLRYNAMYNIGDDEHTPNGIYWDDGLSGQTAYGNLIVNCKANGFLIGGGRDHVVYNNVLINCLNPFSYDDRSIDGVLHSDSWFEHSRKGSDMERNLLASPWKSDIWQNAYPYMKNWSLDYSNVKDPNFIPNPANSRINGNLIVHYVKSIGSISRTVKKQSDLSGNAVYRLNKTKKIFVDPDRGDYRLKENSLVFSKLPDFDPIPIHMIGRMN